MRPSRAPIKGKKKRALSKEDLSAIKPLIGILQRKDAESNKALSILNYVL